MFDFLEYPFLQFHCHFPLNLKREVHLPWL